MLSAALCWWILPSSGLSCSPSLFIAEFCCSPLFFHCSSLLFWAAPTSSLLPPGVASLRLLLSCTNSPPRPSLHWTQQGPTSWGRGNFISSLCQKAIEFCMLLFREESFSPALKWAMMLNSFLELWWLFTYLFKQLLQVCNSNLLQAENMKHKFSGAVL